MVNFRSLTLTTLFFLFLFFGNIWAPPGFRNSWMQLSRFNHAVVPKRTDVVKQPLPEVTYSDSWEEAILPDPRDAVAVVVEDFRDGEVWELSSFLRLDHALNDLIDYITRKKRTVKNQAVIFDVDETLLTIRSFGNVVGEQKDQRWLFRVDSILNFYKKLQEDGGITCFFLTARKASSYVATRSILDAVDYLGGELICLPNDDIPASISSWKESVRIDLVERRGFTVLATLDDQMANLHGGYVGVGVKVPEITQDLLTRANPFVTSFLLNEK